MNSPSNTLYINLKVLQLLPVNHKLYIRSDRLFTHDAASWTTSLQRMSNGDSRVSCIAFLHGLIDEATTYCNDQSQDSPRIIACLQGTISGLQNLRNTYYADVNTKSEIDTIIDNIQVVITNNKTK